MKYLMLTIAAVMVMGSCTKKANSTDTPVSNSPAYANYYGVVWQNANTYNGGYAKLMITKDSIWQYDASNSEKYLYQAGSNDTIIINDPGITRVWKMLLTVYGGTDSLSIWSSIDYGTGSSDTTHQLSYYR